MLCFIIAIIIIGCFAADMSKRYKNLADEERAHYIEEHDEELKRYNISTDESVKRVKIERASDNTVSSTFGITSIVLGIIIIFIYGQILPSEENRQPKWDIITNCVIIGWGFLSAFISIMIIEGCGIKKHVYSRLEAFRCPHCKAPLSYFHTNSYRDDELYYQKKVKKHDFEYNIDYYETQNWIKYKEHNIYTCEYCGEKDDVIKNKEERVDTK